MNAVLLFEAIENIELLELMPSKLAFLSFASEKFKLFISLLLKLIASKLLFSKFVFLNFDLWKFTLSSLELEKSVSDIIESFKSVLDKVEDDRSQFLQILITLNRSNCFSSNE